MTQNALADRGLPVVVQLGFAGSRRLFDSADVSEAHLEGALLDVQAQLKERLRALPGDLGLSSHHFFCGISQVAAGGDSLFVRSCQELQIPQRILLPQHREDYLAAAGSDGDADFSAAEQRIARELLSSQLVIDERVVSTAVDRTTRFEDVNLEILGLSDVLLCVVRAEVDGKPGGTLDVLQRAQRRGRPVLELRLHMKDGKPHFTERWHHRENFRPPAMPAELSSVLMPRPRGNAELPTVGEYCAALKSFASARANWQRRLFTATALVIVSTHLLATIFAVIALQIHDGGSYPWLLAGELVLLAAGFGVHHALHHSHAVRVWAMSRLVAEIARSVTALGSMHVLLDYLFTLPFPRALQPLVRTISVLHLRSTRPSTGSQWKQVRDEYVNRRLSDNDGQLGYYARNLRNATRWRQISQRAFIACSLSAIIATMLKLGLALHLASPPANLESNASLLLGTLAIVLPAAAVAALSLAASFDLEARENTYTESLNFLGTAVAHLREADSEREFTRLVLETEGRLLGETADWAERRSYAGVS